MTKSELLLIGMSALDFRFEAGKSHSKSFPLSLRPGLSCGIVAATGLDGSMASISFWHSSWVGMACISTGFSSEVVAASLNNRIVTDHCYDLFALLDPSGAPAPFDGTPL